MGQTTSVLDMSTSMAFEHHHHLPSQPKRFHGRYTHTNYYSVALLKRHGARKRLRSMENFLKAHTTHSVESKTNQK